LNFSTSVDASARMEAGVDALNERGGADDMDARCMFNGDNRRAE
jgi:hypothetical protein